MTEASATRRAPEIVAEVGCNHQGNMGTALRMIDVLTGYCCEMFGQIAAPPIVKFQKRTPRLLLTEEEYNAPHPDPRHSYGKTYGEHREALEFSISEHMRLRVACQNRGARYSCSVWDLDAAKDIIQVGPPIIKVPSACNLDGALLTTLINDFRGEVHVSTGMTTYQEIEGIVQFFEEQDAQDRLVLYHCVAGYPVPADEMSMFEVPRLSGTYAEKGRCKAIGFSGHHNGIALDMTAVLFGCAYIERHFTLDRTWKGTDHAASLEPDGIRKLIRDSGSVFNSLGFTPDGQFCPIEIPQREKLKRMMEKRVSEASVESEAEE